MTEEWIRWEPIEGLGQKYYIDAIIENKDGFTIILAEFEETHKKLRVSFGYFSDAYRNTYETFRADLTHNLHKKYGKDFYANWSFFKVNNSEYMHWISAQSSGISDCVPFVHFSFLLIDSVLDVLATKEPKLEFFTEF